MGQSEDAFWDAVDEMMLEVASGDDDVAKEAAAVIMEQMTSSEEEEREVPIEELQEKLDEFLKKYSDDEEDNEQ